MTSPSPSRRVLHRLLGLALILAALLAAAPARAEVSLGTPLRIAGGLMAAVARTTRRVADHVASPVRLLAEAAGPTGLLTVVPVPGDSTSPFGYREHPIAKRRKYHSGIDMQARRGTLVRAAGPGVVVHAGRMGGYGKMVVIDHGRGLQTRYAHLRGYDVALGDHVSAGQVVAEVGSTGRTTGPHLHFEVRRWGRPIDPDRELKLHPEPIARGAGI